MRAAAALTLSRLPRGEQGRVSVAHGVPLLLAAHHVRVAERAPPVDADRASPARYPLPDVAHGDRQRRLLLALPHVELRLAMHTNSPLMVP